MSQQLPDGSRDTHRPPFRETRRAWLRRTGEPGLRLLVLCAIAVLALVDSGAAQTPAAHPVISLDGDWAVAESIGANEIPARFDHRVAVPGLTNQARPPFPDVDHYETHEYVWTMKHYGILPPEDKCEGLGRTRQKRNYFWYSRAFAAPARVEHATLVIHKAQFGAAVWLNGKAVGEHRGCFTAGRFDVTSAMSWQGENRLLIRIGAHPGALPDWAFWGSDGEKGPWTPGIYDRVELLLAANPVIESVQVAPRIGTGEILVQTRVKNYGGAVRTQIVQHVKPWREGSPAVARVRQALRLAAGEERVIDQTLKVPGAKLWSPEDPFLYLLETGTGGDRCATRFGMRELKFDPGARRATLNGKLIYLRGASLTLHRFFGDPQCGSLPWNEAWVRKLLVDIPRRMHWNAFRVCIGPAPQMWLDVADEAGLLLQYEFPIWSDREPFRHKLWREDDVEEQMRGFLRDSWNHPSVAIWDASNETRWEFLRSRLVPQLRGLDLSGRPWENGYEQPAMPGDPYEVHPYRFSGYAFGKPPHFQMADLAKPETGKPAQEWHARHAAIINEYDWLWLHRNGTPTVLTRKVYDTLLGRDAPPQERLALNAYLLGGLTEYWRTRRQHAGVLYLAYLDGDLPNAFTCDNFHDITRLELHQEFEDYVQQAFKPLGVCLETWDAGLPAAGEARHRVKLVNDTHETARGRLVVAWEPEQGGAPVAQQGQPFEVGALGDTTAEVGLVSPARKGRYLLVAKAFWDGKPFSPTVSRRKVRIE